MRNVVEKCVWLSVVHVYVCGLCLFVSAERPVCLLGLFVSGASLVAPAGSVFLLFCVRSLFFVVEVLIESAIRWTAAQPSPRVCFGGVLGRWP